MKTQHPRAASSSLFFKPSQTQFTIPLIDLKDITGDRTGMVVGVRQVAGMVGFFQVAKHPHCKA